MLYVLLVEWQYTYACVVSYDTFRIMIVTVVRCRDQVVSKLSLRIFANSQGPQGSRPQGHFVFFSQGSFCWDRVVVVNTTSSLLLPTVRFSYRFDIWNARRILFSLPPSLFFVRLIRGKCTLQSFTVLEQEFSLLGRDSPGMLCEFFVIHGDFTL